MFLFLYLIIQTIYRVEEPDKEESYQARIFEVVKMEKAPILKAYAINGENHGRIFSPDMVHEIFGGS